MSTLDAGSVGHLLHLDLPVAWDHDAGTLLRSGILRFGPHDGLWKATMAVLKRGTSEDVFIAAVEAGHNDEAGTRGE